MDLLRELHGEGATICMVKHDPRYERPAEVDLLLGDASKAKKILDWEPKVRFDELVRIMVDADMDLLSHNTVRKHLGKLP